MCLCAFNYITLVTPFNNDELNNHMSHSVRISHVFVEEFFNVSNESVAELMGQVLCCIL